MSDQRDDDVNEGFDQTNGLADGLTGDSDGTVQGEKRSEAERDTGDDVTLGDGADTDTDTDSR